MGKTIVCLLFLALKLKSQTFNYQLIDINGFKMNAHLLVDKSESIFYTLDKRKQGINMDEQGREYGLDNDEWSRIFYNNGKVSIARLPFKRKEIVYENYKSKIEITKIKKVIGQFSCQKAYVLKGQRKYEVWFDPIYPILAAPFGINGIPGLVVELSGEPTFSVSIKLQSILKNVNSTDFEKYKKFILSKKVLTVPEYEQEVTKSLIQEKRIKMAKLAELKKQYNATITVEEVDGVGMDQIFTKHLIDLPNGIDGKLKNIK